MLCLPFTRGSSTTTAVLLEAIKAGTAPAAIITTGVDTFFALASIVADAMYGQPVPLIALSAADFAQLHTGDQLTVDEDGQITQSTPQSTSEVFRDLGGLACTPGMGDSLEVKVLCGRWFDEPLAKGNCASVSKRGEEA